ncbi:hypothetical protein AEM42_11160 [Betaproteobacteria bacterium UKL13-2]|jgi:uncharacterized membrane protein YedE/YeeE|nr:hypothetical protein AEM42_11160 [Betaproteobacteria bacterium UKL13-2]HCG54278.1 YeeE/YedE family protein [Betaproteobacteria bacterium]
MIDSHWAPWLNAVIGGSLIGLASGGLMLFNGRIAGISGIFHQTVAGSREAWRWMFLVGLVLAGVVAVLLYPSVLPAVSTASPATGGALKVMAAGLLVGFGTRMASGCTSGHGVCGLARFSLRSLAAVVTFLTIGILVTFLIGVVGGRA